MRLFTILLLVAVVFIGCNQDPKKENQEEDDSQLEVIKNFDSLPIVVDSYFDSLFLVFQNDVHTYYYKDTIIDADSVFNLEVRNIGEDIYLGQFKNLTRMLYIVDHDLKPLSFPDDICLSKNLKLLEYFCYHEDLVKRDISNFSCLPIESLHYFSYIDLPKEILKLKSLKQIFIHGRIKKFPYFIDKLPSLKFLSIIGSKIPVDEQKKIAKKLKGKINVIFIEDSFQY